jgi:hypothetical protein
MVLKRFTYESGLDIIAPLKCGTRWLQEKTNPIKMEEFNTINLISKLVGVTNKTYWIYRNNREHLVSALSTEIRVSIEFNVGNIDSIIDGFINGIGTHWSPELYKYMYSYWNLTEFNLMHLNDLSDLFIGIEYDSKNYDMHHYDKTKHTKDDIIKLVGSDRMDKLYELSNKDIIWLNKILNKTHNLI